MFDLNALSRVRFHGGRLVHAVTPAGSRRTGCAKNVRLWVDVNRRHDEPLEPKTPITCPKCLREQEQPDA